MCMFAWRDEIMRTFLALYVQLSFRVVCDEKVSRRPRPLELFDVLLRGTSRRRPYLNSQIGVCRLRTLVEGREESRMMLVSYLRLIGSGSGSSRWEGHKSTAPQALNYPSLSGCRMPAHLRRAPARHGSMPELHLSLSLVVTKGRRLCD